MRIVTATEASRSFAALLDGAERGETFVVTRGGRRIVTIGPASVANGGAVLALLATDDVDDDFADDVAAVRTSVDIVIAAVTAAELLAGVELADAPRRGRRENVVRRVLGNIPVEVYDITVAQAHARLLAGTRREGLTRGTHDLMIAATAVATGRTLVTTDSAARYDELEGVDVVQVPGT